MWTDSNGYKYEVRIHPKKGEPGRYIYRVARSYPPYADTHDRGLGWQYGDAEGNWYQESFLKKASPKRTDVPKHIKAEASEASAAKHMLLPEDMIIP